jgi:hypothetical protein
MLQPLFALVIATAHGSAQGIETLPEGKPRVQAARSVDPITVDGVLSEAVWSDDLAVTQFAQREPDEGAPASERTEVRFAYDDEALYVGARMFDSQPPAIVARLGRRDSWIEADTFVLYLDPYRDGRSGVFFSVNAAGTLRDGILYNDDWDDDTWDGVWEGKARVDAQGWTLEMRIPYSQLRFRAGDAYRWGVNCRRYVGRKKEDDYLVFKPKKSSGFVSRFLELTGIQGVTPPRRATLLPYVTSKAAFTGHAAGDPFNDGSRLRGSVGGDAKFGLGTNLTLDATVNPDFGQVEVDPAVVNLGDVETFFDEKRPFFLEGSSLFQFGYGGASNYFGFNWPGPSFFYSRRIGRAPHGSLPDNDFADVPEGTRILGAAKLTGKVGDRWSLGTLHALTSAESVQLSLAGGRSQAPVEPAAYYGIARLQREFPENRHGLGLIATAVRRNLGDVRLRDQMDAQAYSFGVDGWSFLDDSKTWVVTGWAGLSQVRGSEARIADLQQDAQHYFQRPDATHVELDPHATSLSGSAGRFSVNKEKGSVVFNAAVGYIDPGFDTNDLGFVWRSDLINSHVWGGYRWTDPGRHTRSASVGLAAFRSYDFGGHKTWEGYFGQAEAQLLNYQWLGGWLAYNPETLSNNRTRGGPLTTNPPGVEWDMYWRSDDRKACWVRLSGHGSDYAQRSNHFRGASVTVEWRPISNLRVSLTPELNWNQEGAQWIGNYDDAANTTTFGRRYVFARLDQKTFMAGLRLEWTFTPKLSLQVYAQPLLSSGRYTDFGELARPRSYEFLRYQPGAAPVALPDPDFNFKSLRGSAVARWEFRPGSTLYAVWTQSRQDNESIGELQMGRSFSRLLDARPDNIFLLKIAFWLSR